MNIKPLLLLGLMAATPSLTDGEVLEFSRLNISTWHVQCFFEQDISKDQKVRYPVIKSFMVGTKEMCEQSLKMTIWYTSPKNAPSNSRFQDCDCREGLPASATLPCPYTIMF